MVAVDSATIGRLETPIEHIQVVQERFLCLDPNTQFTCIGPRLRYGGEAKYPLMLVCQYTIRLIPIPDESTR